MPNFTSIGPFKQKLQRGAESPPPLAIPICKKPCLFRVNKSILFKLRRLKRRIRTSKFRLFIWCLIHFSLILSLQYVPASNENAQSTSSVFYGLISFIELCQIVSTVTFLHQLILLVFSRLVPVFIFPF